jgi:energy-coupling factor transporter transmembrane protein EcfT
VRTAVAIIVTVLVAVPAVAAGAYIGLRWARNWRDTIAEASGADEKAAARRSVAHRLAAAVLFTTAFLVIFVVKVGLPRWLIAAAVAYAVIAAGILEFSARVRS